MFVSKLCASGEKGQARRSPCWQPEGELQSPNSHLQITIHLDWSPPLYVHLEWPFLLYSPIWLFLPFLWFCHQGRYSCVEFLSMFSFPADRSRLWWCFRNLLIVLCSKAYIENWLPKDLCQELFEWPPKASLEFLLLSSCFIPKFEQSLNPMSDLEGSLLDCSKAPYWPFC